MLDYNRHKETRTSKKTSTPIDEQHLSSMSSANKSPTGEQPVDKETAKEHFRSSRLSWSNQAEHKLRQELNDIAIAKCRSVTESFAQCAKEQGLLVVFKCRAQNKAMNDCLHQFTSDEQFQAYREKRAKDVLETL